MATATWARGLVLAVGGAAVVLATASNAGANPYGDPYLPPSCEGHQDPESHYCRNYSDDPFGVWQDAIEDELFGS
ncbi:Uncharacterised protein [Mycobacteroides abscessus subsp. bolletii]|nr:Uncharacterised protein [Mycobacteroides abscessus subsp. bolletii]SHR75204.1 Uncharacterised protein [Mycobacteroides abscessus subsp. bolletii]SHS70619.1 Uncharacterised protein [Mycobacteroides abscessus subsp. bolletii]SKF80610.1 Uncharacterised protein [Mycobacteroides abscessus subsp. bolletii]SKG68101.1 Uncharacterised protein [Mycobacteroides abscessus subsp. bolletii]